MSENNKFDDLFEDLDSIDKEVEEFKKEKNKVSKTKKEKSNKKGKREGGYRNMTYTGPLKVSTDCAYMFPDGYDEMILQFKEFIDGLGKQGYTFEDLFDSAHEAYMEGNSAAEIDKIKQKFHAMNKKNTLTYKTVELIAGLLGYNVSLNFSYYTSPIEKVETIKLEDKED